MFDLVACINSARRTYEAGVSLRGSATSGGETEPLKAELLARFKEQATAFGFLIEPVDDAAQASVEGEREAAE